MSQNKVHVFVARFNEASVWVKIPICCSPISLRKDYRFNGYVSLYFVFRLPRIAVDLTVYMNFCQSNTEFLSTNKGLLSTTPQLHYKLFLG